jgi:hypothetical protein
VDDLRWLAVLVARPGDERASRSVSNIFAVTQDRDASRAVRPDTAGAEVPANQRPYRSADAAERRLTATSPQQSTTHHGTADWLTNAASPSWPG